MIEPPKTRVRGDARFLDRPSLKASVRSREHRSLARQNQGDLARTYVSQRRCWLAISQRAAPARARGPGAMPRPCAPGRGRAPPLGPASKSGPCAGSRSCAGSGSCAVPGEPSLRLSVMPGSAYWPEAGRQGPARRPEMGRPRTEPGCLVLSRQLRSAQVDRQLAPEPATPSCSPAFAAGGITGRDKADGTGSRWPAGAGEGQSSPWVAGGTGSHSGVRAGTKHRTRREGGSPGSPARPAAGVCGLDFVAARDSTYVAVVASTTTAGAGRCSSTGCT